MGVAALSFGIGSQLGIEAKNMDFSSRLGRTAVQTGVSTAVSAAKGGDIGQLLLQAGANIAASAVSCAVADEISTWYSNGDIDGVVHKLCHAVSGFLQGMASNLDDPLKGGAGGAFAGLAEGMFEALPDSLSKEARANIAIMGAATAAFLAKQDVNATALTATNAVMHNSCSGEEEKADKDDKGKEEATSSRSNEGTEIEANGITRPKSPRNSEAYIERGLQFGRTNIVDPLYEYVIDPLTQLPVIREVVAFDAEVRQGVGVLMQASEVLERSGYYGALPRNPLTLPGKVEELTNIVASGLRRDCRVVGGSPAFCQDLSDGAKFGFILLTTRGTGGARAVVGQGAVAEAAAGKAFTTEGIVFKGVRDVESVSLNCSRGFQPKVAANYNSPAGDLERWRFTPQIFDKTVTWTAPKGTQQTYKVFQRNDINWNMVRTKGDLRFIGKTNLEASKAGLAPQLNDGYFATLHHIGQDSRGALVEASRRYHGVDTVPHNILHSQFGKNKPNPFYPVDHKLFRKETVEYWKTRIK